MLTTLLFVLRKFAAFVRYALHKNHGQAMIFIVELFGSVRWNILFRHVLLKFQTRDESWFSRNQTEIAQLWKTLLVTRFRLRNTRRAMTFTVGLLQFGTLKNMALRVFLNLKRATSHDFTWPNLLDFFKNAQWQIQKSVIHHQHWSTKSWDFWLLIYKILGKVGLQGQNKH